LEYQGCQKLDKLKLERFSESDYLVKTFGDKNFKVDIDALATKMTILNHTMLEMLTTC